LIVLDDGDGAMTETAEECNGGEPLLVERNVLNGHLKGVTVYYGGIGSVGGSSGGNGGGDGGDGIGSGMIE
jgi:hypothetical protein